MLPRPRKFVFLTLGTKGDLFPFLGIAKELKRRGHPVHVITSQDHCGLCDQEGVSNEWIQSEVEHKAILAHPDIWKPFLGLKIYLSRTVIGTAERAYRAIEKQSLDADCVLVSNNIMVGGILAHEKLGLPMASLFLHPFSHVSMVDPAKDTPLKNFILMIIGPAARKRLVGKYRRQLNACLLPINELRKKLKLEPIDDVIDKWRHSVPLIFDVWPEWFCPAKADWPFQAERTGFIEYDGPGSHEADWAQKLGIVDFLDRKPIVFTMGSGMTQDFEDQLSLFQETCRILGKPGLWVTASIKGQGSKIIDDNFRVIEGAPFLELFEKASIVLTHGGVGTVARALAAGKPIFVAALAFDQFDNGYQIQRLGVGLTSPFKSLTPKKLARSLSELDGNGKYRLAGQLISQKMKDEDGLKTICDRLESIRGLNS